MSHDEIVELLGAYALDALEHDEAELVRVHLAGCPACAAEVAEHQSVAALLGNTSEDAPVHLWEGIAGRLGDHSGADQYRPPRVGPEGRALTPGAVPAPGVVRRLVRQPWLLAAAAAVVAIALLSIQVGRLNDRVSTLRGQQSLAHQAQLALSSPGAQQVHLVATGSSHATLAEVVVQRSGVGYFVNQALPALPATRTYQLWGRSGHQLISLGVLGRHPATVAVGTGGPNAYRSFLVTAEPAGGVVQPSGPLVASSVA